MIFNPVCYNGYEKVDDLVNSFSVTGEYATDEYYTDAWTACTADGRIAVIIQSARHQFYGNMSFAVLSGATLAGQTVDNFTASYTDTYPTIYAAILSDIPGLVDVDVAMDELVYSQKRILCNITVTSVSGTVGKIRKKIVYPVDVTGSYGNTGYMNNENIGYLNDGRILLFVRSNASAAYENILFDTVSNATLTARSVQPRSGSQTQRYHAVLIDDVAPNSCISINAYERNGSLDYIRCAVTLTPAAAVSSDFGAFGIPEGTEDP